MANIAPANLAYVNANGDKGDVQVLSDADITLLNEGLQDIEDLKLVIQKPLPPGTITPFAGTSTVPDGYLLCSGAQVSRVTYAALFTAIGTSYGAGDGSSTFTLPDFRDRFPQGAGNVVPGTYLNPGLPGIWGNTGWIKPGFALGGADGAFYDAGDNNGSSSGFTPRHDTTSRYRSGFNANRCSGLYGASSTVQPPALAINYIIKY